jgi:hypothetical protein
MTGKYYLGRRVVDNYGRTLGKVVGYYTRDRGSPPLLGVELLEGDFTTLPSTHLIDEANILVLDENWKTKADGLAQDLTLIRRKIAALSKLYKSGEVSHDSYESLGKGFDAVDQDLRMRHGILLDKMGERSKALSLRLKEAEDYFVNVKLAHEVGEMDDEAYRLSRDALHDLVNRLQTEQKDIKLAQETLQQTRISLENAEPSQKPPQVEPQAISPEAPIVLRLKEAEE